jgi:hypothetical protein
MVAHSSLPLRRVADDLSRAKDGYFLQLPVRNIRIVNLNHLRAAPERVGGHYNNQCG